MLPDTAYPKNIIGKPFPEFVAEAIIDGRNTRRINSLDYLGKYLLFFFYESDFSLVCPTEMHEMQDMLLEFKKRDVEILSVSSDSIETHYAWMRLARNRGGIEGTTFTMISDIRRELSRAFGVYDEKTGLSFRGTFLVEPQGTIQWGSVTSFAVGRSVPEILRVIDAVQFSKKHGKLCPANWRLGRGSIDTSKKGRDM